MRIGDISLSRNGRATAKLTRDTVLPVVQARMPELRTNGDPLSVSVIIPFRDRPSMVHEAVESVFLHTPIDTEIVVVDDCSLDPAGAQGILKDFNVLLVSLPSHRGVAGARNVGIAVSSGDIIIDLDSDDLLLDGAIEAVVREIEGGADFVYGNAIRLTEQGVEIPTDRPEWEPNCIFNRGCFFVGLKGYRRSLWERAGGFDETLPAAVDLDFALRAEETGAVFARAPEQLVIYREHEGQISFDRAEEQNECARVAFESARRRRCLTLESIG